MFEFDGLKYLSKPRPKNAKGTSYCGVAIIINSKKFIHVETDVLYLKTWMCFGASSGQKNNRSNLRRL